MRSFSILCLILLASRFRSARRVGGEVQLIDRRNNEDVIWRRKN